MKYLNVIPLNYKEILTYQAEDDLANKLNIGELIEIPFGQKKSQGIIVEISAKKPNFKTREIQSQKGLRVLTKLQAKIIRYLSENYFSSYYQALNNVWLLKNKTLTLNNSEYLRKNKLGNSYVLLDKNPFDNYQKLIEKQSQKQTLIVFPNQERLSLFLKEKKEFLKKYSPVIWSGSKKTTEKEILIKRVNIEKNLVILGTRTSLMLPYFNLDLLIIDQQYDNNLKQPKIPRYDSRNIAEFIKNETNFNLILHSEFFDDEIFYKLKNGYKLINNLKYQNNPRTILTPEPDFPIIGIYLEKKIRKNLSKNIPTIIFINKKGKHSAIYCLDCQQTEKCPKCYTTLKPDGRKLVCQICHLESYQKDNCSSCHSTRLKQIGIGIERIREELEKIFPNKTILTTKDTPINPEDLKSKKIIIGTASLRNKKFNKAETLIILYPENMLNLPLPQANLEAYKQIKSVIASNDYKEILIKTVIPDHPLFEAITNKKEIDFIRKETINLKTNFYPPWYDILEITISGKNESEVDKKVLEIKKHIEAIEILGPFTQDNKNKKVLKKLIAKTEKNKVTYDTMLRKISNIIIIKNG